MWYCLDNHRFSTNGQLMRFWYSGPSSALRKWYGHHRWCSPSADGTRGERTRGGLTPSRKGG